jgi:hypothetical protein
VTYINPDSERWQRVKKHLSLKNEDIPTWQESFYESFEKYRFPNIDAQVEMGRAEEAENDRS